MRKVLLVILIGLCSIVAYSSDNEITESEEVSKEVVINHKMIENFNAIEFDENSISFQDLIRSYSINEAKLLYIAYQQGDIAIKDKVMLDARLAELKSERDDMTKNVRQIRLYTNN